MAKVVIAGRDDCPYFARVELVGDRLAKNLPQFHLHKIVKSDADWEPWLDETCKERGWSHRKSPIVWRELIDRGGKGVLIGGANEFQEYVQGFYGLQSDMTSDDMTKVAEENKLTKAEVDQELADYKAQSGPLQICITNASSPVCYNVINRIACGEVFGSSTEIALRLYDSEDKQEELTGVQMEANDLAHGLLRDVSIHNDASAAFSGCNFFLLLDEVDRKEEDSDNDWLKRNSEVFTNYAKIINEVSAKNAKVLLAGQGPLNFNAYIMLKYATNIPRQNIAAMSRMVENHAKSVIANRLNVSSSGVVDLVVWGNINKKSFVDVKKARVHGYDGAIWGPPSFSVSAQEMIHDDKWLVKEFLEQVVSRRYNVEVALNHAPSMSQANAITTTMTHWSNGSPEGQIFSLAVCSEGWYDVPEGMVFSFPVTMNPKGYFSVVQDIDLTQDTKTTLQDIIKELQDEIEVVYPTSSPEKSVEQQTQSEGGDQNGNQTQSEGGVQNGQQTHSEGGEQNSQTAPSPVQKTQEETTVEKKEEGEQENSQNEESSKDEEKAEETAS